MNLKVIKTYKVIYQNPLILIPGDEVKLGEEEKKEEWSGWIKCEFKDNKGWIPKQIVHTEDNLYGIITENYSAKELDVDEGEIVFQIKKLNGWVWVKNIINEEGWIPQENTEIILE